MTSAWLIGESARDEFQLVLGAVETACRLSRVPCLDEAIRRLVHGAEAPDLLILVQSWPGQFDEGQINRLRRAAPLTSVGAMLGSWCEGELRTAAPWSADIRLFWHQWPQRLAREAAKLAAGLCASWERPAAFAGHNSNAPPAAIGATNGVSVVFCQERAAYQWISAVLAGLGLKSTWLSEPGERMDGISLAVCDFGLITAREIDQVRAISNVCPGAAKLVLASFPRSNDVRLLFEAGAAAVLAKPLVLADLEWQLEQSLGRLEGHAIDLGS